MPTPRQRLGAPSKATRPEPSGEAMPLRLTAARGGVGIELCERQALGPIILSELAWSLPGLQFPIDLSGGVREFRHRRGELQHAQLELELEPTQRWITPRVRQVLGGVAGQVAVWLGPHGLGVGLHGAQAVVAFELIWAPNADHARLVVAQPRMAGSLPGPAIAHVLPIVDSIFAKLGQRRGRTIDLGPVVSDAARSVLPPLGVRVPSSVRLWLSGLRVEDERATVSANAEQLPGNLPQECIRALEFSDLVAEADELLLTTDVDAARAAYMRALESAPRHPELCQTVCAIDKGFEERSEAALGLMIESLPATAFGLVGAELLAQVGDEEGAEAAVARCVAQERFAPLAAMTWVRLSEMVSQPSLCMAALDRAVATSPGLVEARWLRMERRADVGDVNGALADAEHAEASVRGAEAKHSACLRAARLMQGYGYGQPARRLFERALRYRPKDAEATLGLARCVLADGNADRAVVLLRRAAELSHVDEHVNAEVQLTLGKVLAEFSRDLPQAIARVREVAGAGMMGAQARALEGRWRAQLGDLAGANVAYGRLRQCIELMPQPTPECTPWLLEGAQLARSLDDPRAAERYLALALRLSPRDAVVLGQYRDVSSLLLQQRNEITVAGGLKAPSPDASRLGVGGALGPHGSSAVSDEASDSPELAVDDESSAVSQEADVSNDAVGSQATLGSHVAVDPHDLGQALEDEQRPVQDQLDERRVNALCQQLLAGATLNDTDFGQLVSGLSQLQRLDELFALLMAKYEDAGPAERGLHAQRLREVLERLIARARAQHADAELEMLREQLQAIQD